MHFIIFEIIVHMSLCFYWIFFYSFWKYQICYIYMFIIFCKRKKEQFEKKIKKERKSYIKRHFKKEVK
jgi:c-di-AMP phosphodiesterase-like protein